jgi:hypothetical protein
MSSCLFGSISVPFYLDLIVLARRPLSFSVFTIVTSWPFLVGVISGSRKKRRHSNKVSKKVMPDDVLMKVENSSVLPLTD